MNAQNNPLKQYFRQPVNYIKLPSEGQYYPEGALNLPPTGEVSIYAMTARDEMMLKTPDALLSGQAVVEIIKSCVPEIKDPWSMPSADMDACLIAIRMATYGEQFDVDTICPNCSEEWRFAVDMRTFLDQAHSFDWRSELTVGELTFKIWPITYFQASKNQMRMLEEQRAFQIINDSEIGEEEKLRAFSRSFVALTEINIDLVSMCVHEIVTPNGTVTEYPLIHEFFANCDRNTFSAVREFLESQRNQQTLKPLKLKCQKCEHDYETPIAFDQSFFSAPNS